MKQSSPLLAALLFPLGVFGDEPPGTVFTDQLSSSTFVQHVGVINVDIEERSTASGRSSSTVVSRFHDLGEPLEMEYVLDFAANSVDDECVFSRGLESIFPPEVPTTLPERYAPDGVSLSMRGSEGKRVRVPTNRKWELRAERLVETLSLANAVVSAPTQGDTVGTNAALELDDVDQLLESNVKLAPDGGAFSAIGEMDLPEAPALEVSLGKAGSARSVKTKAALDDLIFKWRQSGDPAAQVGVELVVSRSSGENTQEPSLQVRCRVSDTGSLEFAEEIRKELAEAAGDSVRIRLFRTTMSWAKEGASLVKVVVTRNYRLEN